MKETNKQLLEEQNSDSRDTQLRRQTLLAHLRELRKVIIICVVSIVVGFLIVFFFFSENLINILTKTLNDYGIEIIYTEMTESFGVQAKISIVAGCVIAAPIVIWQIWSFVIPALYKRERWIFTIVYAIAIILFAVGVVFAYEIVFVMAVNFFIVSGENIATPLISIFSYVNFLLSFVVPFGIIFELPVAIFLLVQAGLLTVKSLTKFRRYVILVIFIIAAILTPPDVVSQVMLGIPLVVLYEVGIIVARIVESRNRRKESKTT